MRTFSASHHACRHSSRWAVRRVLVPVVVLLVAAGVLSIAQATRVSRPAGAATGATGSGGLFVPLQARLLDTTTGAGGYSTAMPAATWRTVTVAGQAGLPTSGIAALEVTVTAVNPASAGVITLQRSATFASVTSLVYGNGVTGTVSNTAIVAVADDGTIRAQAQTATDLRLDVQGYYTSGSAAAGGYVSVNPARLFNTATGTGIAQAPLAAGSDTTIQVTGANGVPVGASAVFVNFDTSNTTAAGGLTAYDTGNTQPSTSLNYPANQTTSVGASVPLSGSGQMTIHVTGTSSTDLLADITGFYTAATSTGAFTPAAARLYDSTVSPGVSLAANATATIQVTGVNGVPAVGSGISAAAVNVHVSHAGPTAGGYARVWNPDVTEPTTDSIDYAPSSTRSNLISTAISAAGTIAIHNVSTFTLNYKIDIAGWYTTLGATIAAGQSRTQERVTLQANAPGSGSYVSYQYRLGTTGSFTAVPVVDVVVPGTSTHPAAWPVPRNSGGTFDPYTWDVGNTAGHGDQLVQVMSCLSTTAAATSVLCSMPSNIELASHAFGASYATSGVGPGTVSLLTGDYTVSATDVTVRPTTGRYPSVGP